MPKKIKLDLKDLDVKSFKVDNKEKEKEIKGGATFLGPNCNTDGICITPYF